MKRHITTVVALGFIAGCRTSVDWEAPPRIDAAMRVRAERKPPAARFARAAPKSEPISAPDPAQPVFVFLNASKYAVAVRVNTLDVAHGPKLKVKDGATDRERYLIEPGARVRVPLDGPGSWAVKTLCYFRRTDGGFQLYGGRTEYRSEPGAYTIRGSMYCGPIEAARMATAP